VKTSLTGRTGFSDIIGEYFDYLSLYNPAGED